jgi:hypothetical protein
VNDDMFFGWSDSITSGNIILSEDTESNQTYAHVKIHISSESAPSFNRLPPSARPLWLLLHQLEITKMQTPTCGFVNEPTESKRLINT